MQTCGSSYCTHIRRNRDAEVDTGSRIKIYGLTRKKRPIQVKLEDEQQSRN
jgi:hypothetical protein